MKNKQDSIKEFKKYLKVVKKELRDFFIPKKVLTDSFPYNEK